MGMGTMTVFVIVAKGFLMFKKKAHFQKEYTFVYKISTVK